MTTLDIRAFGASVQGSAHIATGVVCQDAHKIVYLSNGWCIALIADGVGSAARSDEGARIAVETAAHYVQAYAPTASWRPTILEGIWFAAFRAAWSAIVNHAQREQAAIEDFDTTLTGFIYNGQQLAYGHCGDGGIVALQADGRYRVLTEVQKGDEVNSVYPLRLGESYWFFGHSETFLAAVALMTDGILAEFCPNILSRSDEPVFAPFATHFMHLHRSSALAGEIEEDFAGAQTKALKAFLEDSESIKRITDDKTLVVVLNVQMTVADMDDVYYGPPDPQKLAKLEDDRKIALYGEPDRIPTIAATTAEIFPCALEEGELQKQETELQKRNIYKLRCKLFIVLAVIGALFIAVMTLSFTLLTSKDELSEELLQEKVYSLQKEAYDLGEEFQSLQAESIESGEEKCKLELKISELQERASEEVLLEDTDSLASSNFVSLDADSSEEDNLTTDAEDTD